MHHFFKISKFLIKFSRKNRGKSSLKIIKQSLKIANFHCFFWIFLQISQQWGGGFNHRTLTRPSLCTRSIPPRKIHESYWLISCFKKEKIQGVKRDRVNLTANAFFIETCIYTHHASRVSWRGCADSRFYAILSWNNFDPYVGTGG